VRRGCCYHGIALNVDMDLSPFYSIDPCGYPGMPVTSTARLGIAGTCDEIGATLVEILRAKLESP
jgi:lipoyl(octanoyl) transferase